MAGGGGRREGLNRTSSHYTTPSSCRCPPCPRLHVVVRLRRRDALEARHEAQVLARRQLLPEQVVLRWGGRHDARLPPAEAERALLTWGQMPMRSRSVGMSLRTDSPKTKASPCVGPVLPERMPMRELLPAVCVCVGGDEGGGARGRERDYVGPSPCRRRMTALFSLSLSLSVSPPPRLIR